MAGIYIHIPFCKTRCIYCDFYSTTRSDLKRRYINALCEELTMRRDYLKNEAVRTIYLAAERPRNSKKKISAKSSMPCPPFTISTPVKKLPSKPTLTT